jgi:hypothetical protein
MQRIESRSEQLERRISICHENIAYFDINIERNINAEFAQYQINWYNNAITEALFEYEELRRQGSRVR